MPVSAAASETLLLFQDFPQHFHTRRLLLLHTPLYQPPPPATANSHHNRPEISAGESSTFDANVVMVLSVLLCALICSLGLNYIVRCALRCSSLIATESSGSGNNPSSARLANTGIKKKALKTFPTLRYAAGGLKLPGLDTECAICLSEFLPGQHIRLLPKCNHGFHVQCIDKWLNSHSSCPTCRRCLIQTCQKIVGGSSQEQFSSSAPHETIESIAPLEREGLIRNTYQGIIS